MGDLCGVISSFMPTASVTGRDGKELIKREITIADNSGASMTVALWAERATQEDKVFENHPVVALKSVAVKEFRESKQGSLLQSGILLFNPTSPEASRVQSWWSAGGSSESLTN